MISLVNTIINLVGGFLQKALLPLISYKKGKEKQQLENFKRSNKNAKKANRIKSNISSKSDNDLDRLI
jgi:hypothetical protein